MKNIIIAIALVALLGLGFYYIKPNSHQNSDTHSHQGEKPHAH